MAYFSYIYNSSIVTIFYWLGCCKGNIYPCEHSRFVTVISILRFFTSEEAITSFCRWCAIKMNMWLSRSITVRNILHFLYWVQDNNSSYKNTRMICIWFVSCSIILDTRGFTWIHIECIHDINIPLYPLTPNCYIMTMTTQWRWWDYHYLSEWYVVFIYSISINKYTNTCFSVLQNVMVTLLFESWKTTGFPKIIFN